MSRSLLKPKAMLGCALALLTPALALAQSGYTNLGGEYSLSGTLPGDQLHPRLSVSQSGGYLVWEDNALSLAGSRIRAVALDSQFNRSGNPFRVDTNSVGEQGSPQVALLPNGGAAFVWQGGKQGFQHIYSRFMSSSNTWISGDQLLSASAKSQYTPALATLTNGTVAVVWGSRNQFSANSMQDIYLQLLTPDGTKLLSAETNLNQFTPYNQRNPSIASLPNGGFVVVWVSEQQNRAVTIASNSLDSYSATATPVLASQTPHPSVDIVARLFNSQGVALGNEFMVNSSSNACANPQVAAASDGSFTVVWSEYDTATNHWNLYAPNSPDYMSATNGRVFSTNSWDVFARTFSADGASGSEVVGVNTTLRGDQYLPQISALGTNYLVVWTSLGQDGSREGVFGRFLGGDGAPQGNEFQVNTTCPYQQYQQTVTQDGGQRFIVAWSSYTAGGPSFDVYAQQYSSAGYQPPALVTAFVAPSNATADADPVGATNAPDTTSPTTIVSTNSIYPAYVGNVLSNLTGVAGSYSGLFSNTNAASPADSGYFTATTTRNGTNYSAKILLAGKSYSFSGKFSSSGVATNLLKRSGASALSIQLQLTDLGYLVGTICSAIDGWSADLVAFRQSFDKKLNTCPVAGIYTMAIPPGTETNSAPAGYGVASLTVSSVGAVSARGVLSDGTVFTQSSMVSSNACWPFYASLYRGKGVALTWTLLGGNGPSGQLLWLAPFGAQTTGYVHGFTNQVNLVGSPYAYASGSRMLQLSNGLVSLNGASLSQLVSQFALDAKGRVSYSLPNTNKLSLSLKTATGLLSGSVTVDKTKYNFQGVALQNATNGVGFFLNKAGQSGTVAIQPAP